MDNSILEGLLDKQERVTVADQIYLQTRQLLMSGAVPPGEKVTLRGLAAALNTSPMPVREAVNRLVAEGALEMLPSRGLRVPKPSLPKFREIVRIRCCLEGFAAAEAVKVISDETVARIERHAQDFDKLGHQRKIDTLKTIEANRNLHFTLYEAAAMPLLVTMIENIWLQIAPLFSLSMSSKDRQSESWESFSHHDALLAALRRRDAEGARDAVVADISDAAAYIEKTGNLAIT
ncbi:GntR family transcriptional regulator [Achromobacter sp. UMC46]|uniref:GntR family transcriptional regulator n=1 Tax=Achromobacter sp. UMC46 TaxID=1862319 RepID=UPI00160228D3|nr:GntR family transcriptional regulator [Achromobacter sp. UMC46]MBB1596527.1 GntR family transcriptional regulator [Achromobacter sp. UMC46]